MYVYTSVAWIPRHAGIYYNKLADSIAKSALKQHFDHPYGSITLSVCKRLVAMHVEDLWQLRWNRSLTGHVTNSYIPVVGNNIILPRLRCTAISYTRLGYLPRLLLGNTTLNVHMERMGLAESRICHCGMGIDDEHHFFFECPYYHESRQLLEQSVQDTVLTGPNFVAVNLSVSLLLAPWTNSNLSRRQCKDILEATFEYIQQAGQRLYQHLSSLLVSVFLD